MHFSMGLQQEHTGVKNGAIPYHSHKKTPPKWAVFFTA